MKEIILYFTEKKNTSRRLANL